MITNFSIIQTTISNSCFLILLLITIYYWGKIIFFSNSNTITNINLFSQTGAAVRLKKPNTTSLDEKLPKENSKNYILNGNLGFFGFTLVEVLLTIQLIGRWIESGHFPLSGLYESLLFLTWGIIFFYLFIEIRTQTELLGTLIGPIVLCILAFTGFSLPIELQQNKPLVPALQSNWLFMHVSVMMLSYAALILGCLISICYIAVFFFRNKFINTGFSLLNNSISNNPTRVNESVFLDFNKSETNSREIVTISSQPSEINLNLETSQLSQKKQDAQFVFANNNFSNSLEPEINLRDYQSQNILILFENLSYRLIGIGFCFLTLGILSGAVWANETWGSYWSWDPKETWALITWFTFAIYLHTRILQGWTGIKSASIATFGFFVIWFCYLGVNLLGKGLHSYGFFS